MSRIVLKEEHMKQAVYGASILGGGGGGFIERGLARGKQAFIMGEPVMATIDEFSDNDIFVMVSTVGAVRGENVFLNPALYIKTIGIIEKMIAEPIAGIITSEVGPGNVINGWVQSAATGIPVVDAPADGRAHPTGEMALMGLTLKKVHSGIYVAVGGSRESGTYTELTVKGNISQCSSIIREASIKVGGLIPVAREPVTAKFVKENGCPGALSQAMNIGKALLEVENLGTSAMISTIEDIIDAEIIGECVVEDANTSVVNGIDIGMIKLRNKNGKEYYIDAVDAFMTLESNNKRLATFPDLIVLIDKKTGWPISSTEVNKGQEIVLILVGKEKLNIGRAYTDQNVYTKIENIIGKDLWSYFKRE